MIVNLFVPALLLWQAAHAESPIACNLRALTAIERQQHAVASKLLLTAVVKRSELENGYVFELDKNRITLPQLAQWVDIERRCCPFLDFWLELPRENGPLSMTLTGRPGVKQLLEKELR